MMSSEDHEPVVIHRQTGRYDILGDDIYYPVNHRQVRDLAGKMLTVLDAMGLTDRAHRAAKTLLTQELWRWWDGVYDIATTSYKGCIAPIVTTNGGVVIEGVEPSNRWGWGSEQDYVSGKDAVRAVTP